MTKFRNKFRVESTRLPGYDYTRNGAYFITICTKNRQWLFGDIIDDKMDNDDKQVNGVVVVETGLRPVSTNPEPNQFIDPNPEPNQFIDPNPDSNQFIDPNPESNQFIDPNPEPNHFIDPNPESNHFIDPNPDSKYPIDPNPHPNHFIDTNYGPNDFIDTENHNPDHSIENKKPTIHSINIRLSEFGKIVNECWYDLPNHYSNIILDEFIIMPNHIHGIIIIRNPECQKKKHGLSEFMRAFKSFSTRRIHESGKTNRQEIWQPRFYDHIIKSENELNRIRIYIKNNPYQMVQKLSNQ